MVKTIASNKYLRLLKWLKQSRIDQGLTIRELGDKLGRPSSFVTKTEQGERRLDVAEYVLYCEVLKIAPEEGIQLLRKR